MVPHHHSWKRYWRGAGWLALISSLLFFWPQSAVAQDGYGVYCSYTLGNDSACYTSVTFPGGAGVGGGCDFAVGPATGDTCSGSPPPGLELSCSLAMVSLPGITSAQWQLIGAPTEKGTFTFVSDWSVQSGD